MKLITYRFGDAELAGVLTRTADAVVSFRDAGLPYTDMNALIVSGDRLAVERLRSVSEMSSHPAAVPVGEVEPQAPIPIPLQDVLCLGINYAAHATEAEHFHNDAFGKRLDTIYFSKRVNRATADGEPVPAHRELVSSLDYEAELAVILGKDAYRVRPEDSADYVFGYTIVNDISARNVQTTHKQWYFGKSLDGFTPMGPCITTADEIAFPPDLGIRSYVNGELRQNSSTKLLISGIPEILSELSAGMTLKAGTIIATGTPAGVGMGFDPPRFLSPGDTVTCEIEKIGTLTNRICD
ncbi:MAG: fumarylacetoacetate hydrolase family protein [Clostridia bacterium]|nr:fumarylacetoacetate hydrolase family protein [Clostridia bacterium]